MELKLLSEHDADAVWNFETQHRQDFESWINARPDSYYTPQGFEMALQTSLLMQSAQHAYHYLIWEGDALLGRINLTQVRHAHFQSASVGYRIAPEHRGNGVASDAVHAVMQKAFQDHHLLRLEATARPENPASIRVLLKNGFHQFGHSRASLQLHRQWFDLLYFEAHAVPPMAVQH